MTSERNVSSPSESEILNPGCILAEHNGAHDTRRLPGPICPHESPMCPCVTGHCWSQYFTGAEERRGPSQADNKRGALYQRQIKTQYGRKASYYRHTQSVSLSSGWWIANMRNLVLQCYKHSRLERQGLGDQNVSPWHPDILGCSIQFSALCQLTDRTELGHGLGLGWINRYFNI